MSLFLVGLFKKLALANYLAFYVERVYDNPKAFGAPALMLARSPSRWQIFFDFSGYTDMARGVARLMGFNLILNFNNPYLATGLGEFWSRWHISLIHVVPRLRLYSAGRQPARALQYLPQPVPDFSALRHLARRGLDLCHLGRLARLGRDDHARTGTLRLLPGAGAAAAQAARRLPVRLLRLDLFPRRIAQRRLADCRPHLHRPLGPTRKFRALMLALLELVWLYQFFYESRLRELLRPVLCGSASRHCMVLYLFLFSSGGGAFIYFQF